MVSQQQKPGVEHYFPVVIFQPGSNQWFIGVFRIQLWCCEDVETAEPFRMLTEKLILHRCPATSTSISPQSCWNWSPGGFSLRAAFFVWAECNSAAWSAHRYTPSLWFQREWPRHSRHFLPDACRYSSWTASAWSVVKCSQWCIGCDPQPTPDHSTDTTNSSFNDVNLHN